MKQKRRAVVTGGLGFLGRHLVKSLVADGYEVTILDNGISTRDKKFEYPQASSVKIIDHDVRHPFPSTGAFDEVYHFASRASPTDFEKHPVEIALTNSHGTENALAFAHKHDARVIVASSSAVYGDPEVSPQHESYSGHVPLHNERAPYDEGKRFAEALTEAYVRKHDLDARIIRPFNVYGPRMRPDDGRVIPNFVTQALAGEPITVYGDGTQSRCFCYVDDLIRGVRKLASLPPEEGRGTVVNLGRQKPIEIRELAETVKQIVETNPEIVYKPLPEGDPSSRYPAVERAAALLDWSASTTLQSGLEETVEWYRGRTEMSSA